jgi:hypothetical protein
VKLLLAKGAEKLLGKAEYKNCGPRGCQLKLDHAIPVQGLRNLTDATLF